MKNTKKLLALAMAVVSLFAVVSISVFARDSKVVDVVGQYKFSGYIEYVNEVVNAHSQVSGYHDSGAHHVDLACQLVIEDVNGNYQTIWNKTAPPIGNEVNPSVANAYEANVSYNISKTLLKNAYSDTHISYDWEYVTAYTIELVLQ